MAEVAVDPVSEAWHTRERGVTRRALLDAARRIAERDGIDAISLSGAAAEAGFARATAYGNFRSKDELLQSIVADDLEVLMRFMRRAAGLPEPPQFRPALSSQIVRVEFRPMEDHRVSAVPLLRTGNDPVRGDDFAVQGSWSARWQDDDMPEPETVSPESLAPSHLDPSDVQPQSAPDDSTQDTSEVEPPRESDDLEVQHDDGQAQPFSGADMSDGIEDREVQPGAPHESGVEPSRGVEMAPQPPSQPLSARLPTKDERIRLSGRHATATPELRETLKRLAPAYPPEGESPAEAVARLEKVVEKFDAANLGRMDRRLALVEHSVSGLEERAASSAAAQSETGSTLQVALGMFGDRLDAFEKQHRDVTLKMMAEIRDSARRLDDMEQAARLSSQPALQETCAVVAEPVVEARDAASEPEAVVTPDREEANESAAQETAPPLSDYLANARRAAMSAASGQLETESAAASARNWFSRSRKLLVGFGLVAAVMAGSAMMLRHQFSEPVLHSVQAMPHKAAKVVARKSLAPLKADAAPMDRLTAEARAGEPDAELTVGLKYLSGDGVPKNETAAAGWIAKSAVRGVTLAQYWLATLYDRGRGVANDPVQAFAWFEKSAMGGNRKAMHNLAVAYAQGRGVGTNMAEAARWFSRAADLGYVDSAFNLAVLYERGDGVPQSLLDAYKWYSIAANEGDAESKVRMSAIASELSQEDLAAAQNAATAFQQTQASQTAKPMQAAR